VRALLIRRPPFDDVATRTRRGRHRAFIVHRNRPARMTPGMASRAPDMRMSSNELAEEGICNYTRYLFMAELDAPPSEANIFLERIRDI